MAEIVVSAAITVLCEKLLSGDLMKLARSEGLDSKLRRLNETFPLIQAVLADSGQKQITETPDHKPISLWLKKLEGLAYDIEDVLDDLATEAVRREMNQESHASTSRKVLKFIPTTCCTNFTPRNIKYRLQMSSELDEILTRLNDLVKLKNDLGLNVNNNNNVEKKTERRPEETSVVSVARLMGREGDKDVLLEKLLGTDNNEENVSVVSIVGLGGIGKTTLAKDLFNNDKVKDHFELMVWVCVSDVFDVFNISMSIFLKLNGESKKVKNDLNLLHEALQEKVSKRKFLLVLDDVWNQDHTSWEQLKSPLLGGAPGSRILVTTRIENVALVMGSSKNHHLDVLSDKDALSLFAQNALGENNFDKHPLLKRYGERFVEKCGRLPLALKMIGQALKTKGNDDDRWDKLLQSEIWDIEEKLESKILPALRLSFNELPPELKRPFAYCSLFPKDYVFHKNKIVLLWMAQGFLYKSNCNESLESLGHEYFEKLESRSFFQHSAVNDELGYTMHDLINDLATSVAGDFFFRLDDTIDPSKRNDDETYDKFRHFSLIRPGGKSYTKLKEVSKATRLRTFLSISIGTWLGNGSSLSTEDVFMVNICKLRFLRVLSVNDVTPRDFNFDFGITKVPQSIGGLKHLRYLSFSYLISCLPEQVVDLYNLQSVLLRGCFSLSLLPKSFAKLTKLRHFDIHGTKSLKKMYDNRQFRSTKVNLVNESQSLTELLECSTTNFLYIINI